MIYRTGAFDKYDSILCAGPHHINETRQWEKLLGLKPKQLFEHGYAPLDAIHEVMPERYEPPGGIEDTRVIVAPSWGPDGLLETVGEDVVGNLLDAGYRVTVRPHPRTRQLNPQKLETLNTRFAGNAAFSMEDNVTGFDSYLASDILISDWSGAALEFALGLERPVLFIDLPRKINNPDYQRIEATPIEIFIREQIGMIIDPENIGQISAAVETVIENYSGFIPAIREARGKWIFNFGESGKKGAEIIFALLEQVSGQSNSSDVSG